MADIKIGDIAVYEDDDGKAVWEFEGKVQSDIPLDTDAQDFAGAINELKKLSEAGGGDDWQPPDWWIPVPEPGSWEVYCLVDICLRLEFGLYFLNPDRNQPTIGKVTVDWGDGNIESFEGVKVYTSMSHTYEAEGQYLIKATVDEQSCILAKTSDYDARPEITKALLIAKLGENICLDYHGGNGWLYQLYINDRSEVYIRSLYTSWSSWTRIDAGAIDLSELRAKIEAIGTTGWNFKSPLFDGAKVTARVLCKIPVSTNTTTLGII